MYRINVSQFFVADFRHTIYGKYGTISSPNFPMKYPLNTTVVWFIIVERSKTIQLNFTSFSLEKNKKCLYDHVYIEETKIGAASISRKYCGHHIPPSYKSLSHKIKVVFESDPLSHVDYGFKAMWMEVGGTNAGKQLRAVFFHATVFEETFCILSSWKSSGIAFRVDRYQNYCTMIGLLHKAFS